MGTLGKLHFFCGKMGAGKSTLAQRVGAQCRGVVISEDAWLSAHYPNQIQTFDDYIKHAILIKPFIHSHVLSVLGAGVDVVMDFPANTVKQRAWFASICQQIGCEHQLYYLNVTDEQCLTQIAKRRTEQPERAQFDTEVVFRQVTQFFEPPTVDEGLNIQKVSP
ncbi:ATP-binding protein [Vibrio sp. SCSIO 43136]|uniref:AAA family ATPase n=1 Tax=Vibrio sp. SCSIO 43136 TaxID=2819101 RepID=UPI0020751276|nr:ATP-binding protein [Vibrio sp. SCSIO 43136]USD67900.1 ATP-binding protein [Vibrio sp. SCSIO 43136]